MDNLFDKNEVLNILFESENDLIVLTDTDGIVLDINNTMCNSLEHSKKDILGQRIWDFIDKSAADIRQKIFNQVLKSGKPERIQDNNNNKYFDTVFYPVKDKNTVKNILIIARDITIQKDSETNYANYIKLQEQVFNEEKRIQQLLKNIPDVICRSDINGNTVYTSNNIVNVTGYTSQEICSEGEKLWFDRIHPDDTDNVINAFTNLFNKGERLDIEYRYKRKDNKWVWLHERSLKTITINDIQYADSIFSDITEKKDLEITTLESETKFKTIFNKALDAIIVADIETKKFIDVNDIACKMLGYSKDEFLNLSVPDIHPKEDLAFVITQFERQARKEIQIAENIPVLRKDGTIFYADVNSNPVEINKKIYLMGIFRDVTEKNKLQEQLIHSEKLSAVGQLAAGIAHEFNNILAIIQMNEELLQLKNQNILSDDSIKKLNNVSKSVQRGKNIVRNMMSFAKPSDPKKYLCRIENIIETVLNLQSQQFILENIEIDRNYSTTEKVLIDKGQFEQVFLNLIINARHAIIPKGGGKIRISIHENKDSIEVIIADNGIGMDADTKRKIFTPFFSTKGAYAEDNYGIKGTGLGLSVSYTIIQYHNGEINFKSKKGIGTEFIIQLPLPEKKENINKEKTDITPNIKINHQYNVLVIDDEKEFLNMFKDFLEYNNCTAAVCTNGDDALDLLKNNKFDAIFLDLVLPGQSGKEIFKSLREINKECPIIFMSGQVGLEIEKLKDLGAYDFLQKPFKMTRVIDLLNGVDCK